MISRAFTSTRYSNRQPSRSRIIPLASSEDQRLLPTGSVPSVLPISSRRSRSSMSTSPGTFLNGLAISTWNTRGDLPGESEGAQRAPPPTTDLYREQNQNPSTPVRQYFCGLFVFD